MKELIRKVSKKEVKAFLESWRTFYRWESSCSFDFESSFYNFLLGYTENRVNLKMF